MQRACTEYHTKRDGLVPTDPRQCQSGYAEDKGRNGYRCTSVKHLKYGPYVNSITNRVTYNDLPDQTTRQCFTSSSKGFDDTKSCKYLTQNDKLNPEDFMIKAYGDRGGFTSPFFNARFMFTG